MLGLIAAALGLATEVMKFMGEEANRKYGDKLYELNQDLLKEEAKGYDSDDSKIEYLYKEVKITLQALQTDLALKLASHSS